MNPDDFRDAVPRCPRCLEHTTVEHSGNYHRRWYCTTCDLVFNGTRAEHQVEAAKRAADLERDQTRAQQVGRVP